MRYPLSLIESVQDLRKSGKTYGEIRSILNKEIPKSTLSEWCKQIPLSPEYKINLAEILIKNRHKGRLIALEVNRVKRQKYLEEIVENNLPIAQHIYKSEVGKIALAMLCLGEASKYSKGRRAFSLGSSDPRIIIIFLSLLKQEYDFSPKKVRCTVQCRADQDIETLEDFWRRVTSIPKEQFYKARVDPRTIGKPTVKSNYKGVLRIDYLDTNVQLHLESLAELVYKQLVSGPEV